MSNNKIFNVIEKRREEFCTGFGLKIFGIFYFGSENYNLSDENSDVDCRLIYFPPIQDFNKQFEIQDYEANENQEHIECMDIKMFFHGLSILDLQILESLSTDYYWINPDFETEWEELRNIHDKISHCNERAFIENLKFKIEITLIRLQYLEGEPSLIKECGYAAKAAHHILRLEEMWDKYITGASFKEASLSTQKDLLISMKRGEIPYDEAERLWTESSNRLNQKITAYTPKKADLRIEQKIYNIYQQILKKYLGE